MEQQVQRIADRFQRIEYRAQAATSATAPAASPVSGFYKTENLGKSGTYSTWFKSQVRRLLFKFYFANIPGRKHVRGRFCFCNCFWLAALKVPTIWTISLGTNVWQSKHQKWELECLNNTSSLSWKVNDKRLNLLNFVCKFRKLIYMKNKWRNSCENIKGLDRDLNPGPLAP